MRPSTHGYAGSEEFIRLQFEEYLLALLATAKHQAFVETHGFDPKANISEPCEFYVQFEDYDLLVSATQPSTDFSISWIEAWKTTENFRIFNKNTGKPEDADL